MTYRAPNYIQQLSKYFSNYNSDRKKLGGLRYHWFYFKRITYYFTFGTCAKNTFFWDFKSGHTIIYNFSNIHTHTWFVNLHCQISKVPAYKECNLLKTGTTVTLTHQKFDDLFQIQDLQIRNKKQFGFMWSRNDILRRLR